MKSPSVRTGRLLLTLSCVILVGIIVWRLSPLAMIYLLTDGLVALGIMFAATTFGMWFVPLFFPAQLPALRWHMIIGAGLGTGLLSLSMLALGAAGLLHRPVIVGGLLVLGAAGLARLLTLLLHHQACLMPEDRLFDKQPQGQRFNPAYMLLLGLMPFLALALLATTVPPGVIWTTGDEAGGYDVLEYHLQVPKEYYHDGQITYLPHNIYSNFPMNAEMFYLLAMIVKGDTPQEGAILGKFLNTLMGVLFVLTAWTIGREYDLVAGVVCALLAGSAPWVMYLCGMAYVENGMLFFGMLSVACVGLYADSRRSGDQDWRLVFLAGLFVGLSCGFKYTAVAMLAIPLFMVLCMLAFGRRRSRTRDAAEHEDPPVSVSLTQRSIRATPHPAVFLLGTLMTFSPWLAKNTVMTGNPVFPLAYDSLGAREGVWTDELADRWQQGHQVEVKDSPWKARLGRFKERILVDRRLGWWLIALSLPILFSTARSRLDLGLFLMFVLQASVWLVFTHLFARFAVVMLIPLCVLGGRSVVAFSHRVYRGVFFVVVAAVAAFNTFSAGSIYADELVRKNSDIHGHVEWFYNQCNPDSSPACYVRQLLSGDERILMIGEARAFYMPKNVDYCVLFNRNPLAEAVTGAKSPEDVIRWLNSKGYTHILVFWNEMHRLRNTYGFWEELTPELFTELETVGLGVIKNFDARPERPYATLYEVRAMLPREEIGDGA